LTVDGSCSPRYLSDKENKRIIPITDRKGGTGKTTTAAARAVLPSRAGVRILPVEMAPQTSPIIKFSADVLSIAYVTAAAFVGVVAQPGRFNLRTIVHLDDTVRVLK
jgi:Mrp family chromosome partitioning ATPase